jgi:hypothetical protein
MYIKTPRHIYHYLAPVQFTPDTSRLIRVGVNLLVVLGTGINIPRIVTASTQNANLTCHNPKTPLRLAHTTGYFRHPRPNGRTLFPLPLGVFTASTPYKPLCPPATGFSPTQALKVVLHVPFFCAVVLVCDKYCILITFVYSCWSVRYIICCC